jgi:hypothetical protein
MPWRNLTVGKGSIAGARLSAMCLLRLPIGLAEDGDAAADTGLSKRPKRNPAAGHRVPIKAFFNSPNPN